MFLNHIYLIPLFPAFGAAMMFFFGRRLQKATVNAVCVGAVVIAFLFACFTVVEYTHFAHGTGQPFEKIVYTWLGSGDGGLTFVKRDGTPAAFNADAGFLLDPLSSIWLLFVTGVGMLIHIYSTGYMAHEGGYYRFFGYLNLFMFSMLTLILANNYLLMFVGWEGVGLCSYLLIGFYFHKHSASTAANKAFITNRIGDAGVILGSLTIFWLFGTFDFVRVTAMARAQSASLMGTTIITMATLALLVGACGKSAQLPLYVWLPDAMEGPTPVSALIHAATMVTAGVYMVARSWPIYVHAPSAMNVVATVGIATAFFAATIGLVQNDIKKVFAYSTVSQLGYMFVGVGCGAFSAGIWHLMTHAFFKALLFLGSGSVIHALSGEQDLRNMGGLRKKIRWTFLTMMCAAVAIAGVPPFSGFYSKDAILLAAHQHAPWMYWVGVVTAGMTAFYVFRAMFLAFFGEYRGKGHPHESPPVMLAPLAILAVLSLVGGFLFNIPQFLSGVFPAREASEDSSLMLISVGAGAIGILLAWFIYVARPAMADSLASGFGFIYKTLYNKYFVDEFYDAAVVRSEEHTSELQSLRHLVCRL